MSGRTHPLDRVPGLRELATRQLGAVRRDQLAALGVGHDHVRSQVAAQRWRVIGPFVVVLTTGALTRAQQRAVAVLHAGRGARLAGRTALEHQGLRGWETDTLHVAVPRGRRPPRLPGVVIHSATTAGPLASLDPLGVPATTARTSSDHAGGPGARYGARSRPAPRETWPPVDPAARAAVDAASWEPRATVAVSLVIAVVQQRLASAADVLTELDGRNSPRHARAIRTALCDIAAGAESRAELDVARLVRRAGLGRPRRQVLIETPDGPVRVDLLVQMPDGRQLVIEVDGPHHDDPRVRSNDLARDAALTALGYVVLRIPVVALRADPDRVLAQLRALASTSLTTSAG